MGDPLVHVAHKERLTLAVTIADHQDIALRFGAPFAAQRRHRPARNVDADTLS